MFKKYSLVQKLVFGFAICIVLASLLGFTGWRGVNSVKNQMKDYADWGEVDMIMNEDVTQNFLILNNTFSDYKRSQTKQDLNALKGALNRIEKGVTTWASLDRVKKNNNLYSTAEEIKELVARFKNQIDVYTTNIDIRMSIEKDWQGLIEQWLVMLEETMEEVIDPAKEKAEKRKNIVQMVQWGEIDMVMNEAVIANVLKLQTECHDYAAKPSQDTWKTFQSALTSAEQGLAEWKTVLGGEKDMLRAAEQAHDYLTRYQKRSQEYLSAVTKMEDIGNDLTKRSNELYEHLETAMETVIDPAKDKAIKDADSVQKTSASVVLWLWFICVVCGIFLAIFITRSISLPIHNVIATLSNGAKQVSTASQQLSSSSQQMSEGASEQASSLEEVSSSLEEMSSMTKQNADNSKQASTMASETSTKAEQGKDAMNRMGQAIDRIKKSSDETAKIIKTIDEIAMQTNLLALNAAVEAARAGEAGRGFAVVAEEVRNLAQRSAQAAKNTAELIEGAQKNSDSGVSASEEVGKILIQIIGSVQKVTQLIAEVSAASNEQAQGIDQVSNAVAQMDKLTQSNAASAEESASASEELSGQAQNLDTMVVELLIIVGGNATANRNQTSPHGHFGTLNETLERADKKRPENGDQGNISKPNQDISQPGERRKSQNQKALANASNQEINPECLLPLDDDQDLKEF